MRVAALYDVHGNLPALEAVLGDAERERVDTIVFGGDIVSGPLPRETIELVRSLDAVWIQGNADVFSTPALRPDWEAARRWVEAQLDEKSLGWLATLPFSWSADDTLYVHANPVDIDGIVTELTPDECVAVLVRDVSESRIVTGHVHMQFERCVGSVQWIGVGSVGMPYEDVPGAYWAVVSDEVEFRRTDYDLEAAAAAIRASRHPFAEQLAAENVLTTPMREEALAAFGG